MAGAAPPSWYPAIRACRYAGVDFCTAYGIPWSPIVRDWMLTAESAENEAEHELMKRAQAKASRG